MNAKEEYELHDSQLNFDDILNDDGLNRELLGLGWQENDENVKLFCEEESIDMMDSSSSRFDGFDAIGVIDESSITLNAEDFEDPELISQLMELGEPMTNKRPLGNAAGSLNEHKNNIPVKLASNITTSQPTAATSAEAKSLAVKYKREGNDEEALRWFRIAKQLETKNSTPSKIITTHTVQTGLTSCLQTTTPKLDDSYAPLEAALVEASTLSLREAKKLEKSDPKTAVERLREYKAYQQELVVLKSRREAGAAPALFRWHTTKKSIVQPENLELGEDQMRVTIEGAVDLDGVLEGHSSRSISVSYSLGLSAKEDSVPLTTAQAKYEGGRVQFNYTATLSNLKRGRHVQQLYARKKATFDLILHRGFFKSNLLMCQAVLPLSDLLTKSEIGGTLTLISTGQKEGVTSAVSSVKKGKAVGGSLKVLLRIRSPLMGPDIRVVEERTLVVDPWPSSPHGLTSVAPSSKMETAEGRVDKSSVTESVSSVDEKSRALFASLSEKEKADPHSPDLIESNDVLELEIQQAEKLLSDQAAGSVIMEEDELFNCRLRLQLLQAKLQILVCNVQNESLSIDQYLQLLRACVARDQVLAVYFRSLGDKESMAHALRILRRTKVMQQEIASAQDTEADEDSK